MTTHKAVTSKGTQLFSIPNDVHGQYFINLMRLYGNGQWQFHVRGRGTRKSHGNQYSLPIEHSDWLAVYIRPTKDNKMMADARRRGEYDGKYKACRRIRELMTQIEGEY